MLEFIKNLFKKEEVVVKQEEVDEITVKVPKLKAVDLYKTVKHSRKNLISCKKAIDKIKEELLESGVPAINIEIKPFYDRMDNNRLNGYRLYNSQNYTSVVYFVPKKEIKNGKV